MSLAAELATIHRFTVQEYRQMAEAGVFAEDERIELVEGEIVEMSPIGPRHIEAVIALNALLLPQLVDRYDVSVQMPVGTDPSGEPQPDLTLLRKARTRGRIPAASDAALVVEVSDTSLRYDREVKGPLYARAGVPELWIVNLVDDIVEVSTEPGPEGYGATIRFSRGQRVDSPTLPNVSFDAEEILPPHT